MKHIVIGFDGFVDTLLDCVNKRLNPKKYRPIKTITEFAAKAHLSAGKSANIELVAQEQALGGNGPLLAQGLASLGFRIELFGCCGLPTLHPVFKNLKNHGVKITSFAEPGYTDALEFTDGKLLLGKMGELGKITLKETLHRISEKHLLQSIQESPLIASVNWTMMPLIGEFWKWLFIHRKKIQHRPYLFVDLADPAKRPQKELQRDINLLAKLNTYCPVVLGLNRSEAEQIATLFKSHTSQSLKTTAQTLIKQTNLNCIIIHTRHEVAGATHEEAHVLTVPYCKHPKRQTGAGDNFNAGIIAGILHKKPLEQILQSGISTSGIWVRKGKPASHLEE